MPCLSKAANGTVRGNAESSDQLFFLASAGLDGAVSHAIAGVGIFADGETTERGITDGETTERSPADRQATKGEEAQGNAADERSAPTASPPMAMTPIAIPPRAMTPVARPPMAIMPWAAGAIGKQGQPCDAALVDSIERCLWRTRQQ